MATLAPPSPRGRRLIQPLIWRLQSLMSAYLPLLLMAFLASGTWWLVKNTPMPDGPTELVAPRHEPDYRMSKFELQRVGPDGKLRVRVEGGEMRHYPDTDTMEIDAVRVRAFGEDGSLTLATANRAISNGDASEMQLLGNVNVKRFDIGTDGEPQALPKLEVRGEFLQAFVNTEKLSSHLPVQLFQAGGVIQAQRFEYDHLHGGLTFSGRTSARFDPPGVKKAAAKK